jgi:hypothetical protein
MLSRVLPRLVCLTVCSALSAQTRPASVDEILRESRPGQIVTLPDLSLADVPTLAVERIDAHGPQLLFSDMPEYFRSGDGIAIQEEVRPGIVRLYLYHVPEPGEKKKIISAVIENLADEPTTMRFLRYSFPAPGTDYHKIGKAGLLGYFTSKSGDSAITIAPHGRAVIDPELDKAIVTKDMLVHAIYEFEIDRPAQITTFQRDPSADSLAIIDKLPRLPRIVADKPSGAGRGLFLTSDFDVKPKNDRPMDTSGGPVQIVVADGKSDPWITGRDSIAGIEGVVKGNYGVMYRIKLRRSSSDGRALALLMCNARGGQWCRYSAAAVMVSDGLFPGGATSLPADQVRFGTFPEAVVIQRFAPIAPGETGTIEFTYSPPGASCLPTPLLLIPYKP